MNKRTAAIIVLMAAAVFVLWPLAMICRAAPIGAPTVNFAAAVTAKKYIGVTERGSNSGPDVERFLASVGLGPGYSWCMAFVNYSYHAVGFPWYRSARCSAVWDYARSHEITYKTFTSDDVAAGSIRLQPGDVPIWRHGSPGIKNFNGHTGIVQWQQSPNTFVSVEGNTSSGAKGSQSNGDGVYQRTRPMGFGTNFRVEGFIRPRHK